MATYSFYLDEKVTMWERRSFVVESETFNGAIEQAKQMAMIDHLPDDVDHATLYDTSEYIPIEMNNGMATRELYNDENDEILWSNEKKQINND
jgi:hypothetical protein